PELTPGAQATWLHLRFFAVLAALALFLITGPYAPVGELKDWVAVKLGLIGPFRSVYQRFGVYLVVAYAPLLAAGTDVVVRAVKTRTASRVAAAGVLAALAGVTVVFLAWPMWSGR